MVARSSLNLKHRAEPLARAVASLAAVAVVAALLVADDASALVQAQPVQPSLGASAVSAGGRHSCGLRTDGTITCWGANHYGQADAPSGSFSAVSAGRLHSCGLRTDGTITCWGWNEYGQADAPGGSFSAVSAGGAHSCGLRTDGTITCWGWNEYGQADAPSGSFSAVSAGGAHSCGLRIDGTITCWGHNAGGQADAPSGSFSAVTTGNYHSCAIRTDGTITCWGFYGQLDAPSGSFSAVSAGDYRSCGLRIDGTITCWGSNRYGQADAPSGSFSAVSDGDDHSCGLRIDGTITCWGDNRSGLADAPSGQFGPPTEEKPLEITNDAISSPTAGTSNEPATDGVPGVVGELTATPLPGGGVLVDWSAPTDDGGSEIVEYEVRYSREKLRNHIDHGTRDAWHITKQVGVKSVFYEPLRITRQELATSHTNDWLLSNVRYSVSVTAVNRTGSGSSATTTFKTFSKPGVPRRLSATPRQSGGVVVSWAAPSNGGSPILGYDVTYSRGALRDHAQYGNRDRWYITKTVPGRSHVYLRLLSNVRYTVSVEAVNGIGSSRNAATSTFTTMLRCPTGDKYTTRNGQVVALQDFFTINDKRIETGDVGGTVENEQNLSQSGCSWIFEDAEVSGDARVRDNAVVDGNARVHDRAQVYGDAEVYGNAEVYHTAHVYERAQVYGKASVYFDSELYVEAKDHNGARVYGDAEVYGNAEIYNNARVYSSAKIYDDAQVYDAAKVHGQAHIYGEAEVYFDPVLNERRPESEGHPSAQVHGNARVYDQARVHGYAELFGNAVFSGELEANDGKFDGEQEHVRAGRELYAALFAHIASELTACDEDVGSYSSSDIPRIVRNLLNDDYYTRILSEIHVANCQRLKITREVLNFFVPKLTWWDVAFAVALTVTGLRGSFYLKSLVELAQGMKPLLDLSKIPDDIEQWEVDTARMFEQFKKCKDSWNSAESCEP